MTSGKYSFLPGVALGVLVLAEFAPSAAMAQTAPVADAPAATNTGMADIVVTARKRPEALLDVPVTISVVDSATIARRGIGSIGDIARITPGLQYSQAFGPDDNRPTLRGISTVRGRPSVAILEDGIDTNGAAIGTAGGGSLMNPRLIDVEQIEVVKGPQSTIYGRNAFSGAINYVTKKPTDHFEAGVSGGIATHDDYDAAGYISGPLNDKIAFRLNAAFHEFDGFYRNVTSGKKVGYEKSYGVRAQLQFKPTEDLTILARYTYNHDNTGQGAATLEVSNASAPNGFRYVQGEVTVNPAGVSYFGDPNIVGNTHKGDVNVSWDLGNMVLTSETYGLSYSADQDIDASFGQLPGLASGFSLRQIFKAHNKVGQISQEFRLASVGKSRLKYTLGAYFLKENAKLTDKTEDYYASCANPLFSARPGLACSPSPNVVVGPDQSNAAVYPYDYEKRNTTHFSFYGSLSYELIHNLNLTGELRYTTEKVEVAHLPFNRAFALLGFAATPSAGFFTTANFLPTGGYVVPGEQSASTRSNYFNPRVSIDYKPSQNTMVYGSFAKGTKPGGFSQLTGTETYDNNVYKPEKLYSWEVGFKGSTADHKLTWDVDGFLSRYLGQQVNYNSIVCIGTPTCVNTTRTAVTNAGQVNTHGAELQLAYRPIRQISLNFNYAYTISKYKEFASIDSLSKALFPNISGPGGNVAGDLSGNTVPDVPKNAWSATVHLEDHAFGDIDWSGEVVQSYVGKRFLNSDATNTAWLPHYYQTDVNLGLGNKVWAITAYVKNLLNDDTPRGGFRYVNTASASGGELAAVVYLAPKRQFGLRGSYKF